MTIFKYPIPAFRRAAASFWIEMPNQAQLLDVQVQDGQAVIWALVNPERPLAKRAMNLYWTGGTGPMPGSTEQYVGTYTLDGLVWHLFAYPGFAE